MDIKLFKWIGGKSWLSQDLNNHVLKFKNKNIETYIEPFAGGLGSFISVFDNLKLIGVKNFHLNDINSPLINTYNWIKKDPQKLINIYFSIEDEYLNKISEKTFLINKKDKDELKTALIPARDFYNSKKKEFNEIKNEPTINTAALFLFITNHNFNGIYRENKKGEFNVSYNWEIRKICKIKKTKTIIDYSNLFNDNNIFFYNLDCFEFINLFIEKNNSLFYLDPPYINKGKGENHYNENSFLIKEQSSLLKKISNIENFIFSNNHHDIFVDECKTKNYKFFNVYRKNLISQNKKTRGKKIKEIIIVKN